MFFSSKTFHIIFVFFRMIFLTRGLGGFLFLFLLLFQGMSDHMPHIFVELFCYTIFQSILLSRDLKLSILLSLILPFVTILADISTV